MNQIIILTNIFPDKLKLAKIIPLFKKGDPTIFSNYRPISLLPVISKVFERILHDQIFTFSENNSLSFSSRYGYRQQHSIEFAAVQFVEHIISRMDNKKDTFAVFMD